MRNKYPGICYQCGKNVTAGDGHFERYKKSWHVQGAACAITSREAKYKKQEGASA